MTVTAVRVPNPQDRRWPERIVATLVVMVCLGLSAAYGQNDVLTQHNDSLRTGANVNESILSPANVTVSKFGKLFTQPVDGIIVGQPLYVSNLLMPDGTTHNVVYVATQHNTVYAFDADSNRVGTPPPLWSVSLNNGGTSVPITDYGCTGTHYTEIGIMGTPVIDPGRTTLYVVAKTVANGQHFFTLHALSLLTGNEVLGGPANISGSVPSNTGSVAFDPTVHMQRPALLLANGVLYIGFGSNGCDAYNYRGWLFAYDASTLQQLDVFMTTPNGKRGSIWQSGSGPAADVGGSVYVATANGTFDAATGGRDFGDSILKLGWTAGAFGLADYFTPYNQQDLANNDLDLGSGGPLLLPDQPGLNAHELVAGGKEGTLYLIDRDNLGGFNPTGDVEIIQSIPHAVYEELNGVPAYWNSNVYVAGDLDYIKQFGMVNGLLTQTPLSQSTMPFNGAGPASISVSANGTSNGIVWAIRHPTPALFAFDATNLASKLYDSTLATSQRDKLVPIPRFTIPTVNSGKVYIGGTTSLVAYGLLPILSPTGGNNQTAIEKSTLPVPLSLHAADAYASQPIAGVSVTCKDGGVGGVFTPSATLITDAAGNASVTYTLPGKPRDVTITCASLGFISAVFKEHGVTGPPAKMNIVSGNQQIAPPNTQLPYPLVVKVSDINGYGVSGVTVTFTDKGAGGSFSATSVVTDIYGKASTQYTTPNFTGTVTITASIPQGLSVKFAETVQ